VSWRPVDDDSGSTMMRREKQAKLVRKGWKVGTVQEFLGLSDEEAAYVELRVRLANSLRQRRQRKSLSQAGLAALIGSSQSRVAKMEGGDSSVSIDLLIRSLLALGATSRDLAQTISRAALPKAS
jgi:predicted XRE-type DNA-binding protein